LEGRKLMTMPEIAPEKALDEIEASLDYLRAATANMPWEAAHLAKVFSLLPTLRAFRALAALSGAAVSGVTEGWRTIESAPRDGTPILIYHERANAQAVAVPVIGGWYVPRRGPVQNPTHWRPLPTPPASKETET
jgi:hypothetical protein